MSWGGIYVPWWKEPWWWLRYAWRTFRYEIIGFASPGEGENER